MTAPVVVVAAYAKPTVASGGPLADLTGGANDPPRLLTSGEATAMRAAAAFAFTWTTSVGSASLGGDGYPTFLSWSADDNASLYYDVAQQRLKLANASGTNVMDFACTFAAASVLTITIDPDAMTLTLAGAGAGNGTHAISGTLTAFWPVGATVKVGGGQTGIYLTGGTYSDVVAV